MTDRWALAGLAALCLLALSAAPATASQVSISGSELEIDGDPDSDVITLSTDGTTLTVTDTGPGGVTTADLDCTTVDATTVTCPAMLPGESLVDDFEVVLDDGVDSFVNKNLPADNGHVHAFTVAGGLPASGAKTMVGGPGDQLLEGGLDSDSLDGGDGDDRLLDGGGDLANMTGGNDVLIGGAGTDSTGYTRFNGPAIAITLDSLANDGQAGEADNVQVEDVITGEGDDIIVGDASPNALSGGPGNDVISGLAGSDELTGDFGGGMVLFRGLVAPTINDTLNGGEGRDGLNCGRGFDVALRDPSDRVEQDCERIGADVVGDTVALSGKKKNKFGVEIACPETEGAACAGSLQISVGEKKIGKGTFTVASAQTKKGKAKLTKKGVKAIKGAHGTLLVTVDAFTAEPGGVSHDTETILLHR